MCRKRANLGPAQRSYAEPLPLKKGASCRGNGAFQEQCHQDSYGGFAAGALDLGLDLNLI